MDRPPRTFPESSAQMGVLETKTVFLCFSFPFFFFTVLHDTRRFCFLLFLGPAERIGVNGNSLKVCNS